MEFPGSYFFYGNRLKNHLIRTIDVMDQDSCELSCYIEHNCVSINFEVKASASGTHKCDLNNSTHKEHDKDLVKSPGYIYHGTNVRILRYIKCILIYFHLFWLVYRLEQTNKKVQEYFFRYNNNKSIPSIHNFMRYKQMLFTYFLSWTIGLFIKLKNGNLGIQHVFFFSLFK